MKNNWILMPDTADMEYISLDYDNYDEYCRHHVSIGDEIEAGDASKLQYGIVVGIVRNMYAEPVCYKVVRLSDENDKVGTFDYIAARDVYMCEPCGDATWSLERIGYQFMEDEVEDAGCYYNATTKDVILW